MQKALLYEKVDNNTVQCNACKFYCKIKKGKTGICGVRKNINQELYLLVYGKASATNIDPIEKKPLFHFLPGTDIFSFGTVGCNFRCSFCQNWDLINAVKLAQKDSGNKNNDQSLDKRIMGYGDELLPKTIVAYCKENNIPSIAYTYNEPSIFFEYTYDTAKLANKQGIKNVYVSNGYASKEAIDTIAPFLDAVNVDLKSFSDKFYRTICQARLEKVLETIKYYYKKKIWLEITTLFIPDENDSKKEMRDIAKFIASVSKSIPWHISRFSPAYKMKNKEMTPKRTLIEAYEIGKEEGLKYVYIGNVYNNELQSTFCPKCNNCLIERDWGYLKINGLVKGKCKNCGEKL